MSFARTKIQQPRPRAGLLLARPALESALVDALQTHRVVLVCAAAGYGKTALLGRAIEQLPSGPSAAWVSLDEGDDLHRLLACLTAALEPFDPPWRTAPEGLVAAASQPGAALQEVADEIVNTLDACELPHGVIVLDDLHHMADPACIAFLDLWLQRMSPRWTVAIAARHEPPLRLTRLRATGELAEFREAQLQFARDEVRQLVARAGLDDSTADALHARTAGWAAGLRLALNGARGGSAVSAMDRHAFEFLTTEVLARIDPELREFLLRTSVLQDLDAPRCAAVTGDPQAMRRLDEVERLGLFVTIVDDVGPTLRLHDLFRDALRQRLKQEHPADWPDLLARAATVESDPVRQQALLLQAGRLDQAAATLSANSVSITNHGGSSTMLHLIDQFPADFVATSPELQRAIGMARWNIWDTLAAERHLAQAEALFAARGDAVPAALARGHRAVTLVALGRLDDAGRLIDAMPEPGADCPPAQAAEMRIVTRLARTWHALESCRFDEVAAHFSALVDALESRRVLEMWFFTVPPPRQTSCRGVAATLSRWASGALQIIGDRPVPLRTATHLAQGWAALWQGRLAEAQALLETADADAQWTGQQTIARSHSLGLRAMLHAARGERDEALETVRNRIAEHPAGYGHWGLWHLLFFGCRIAAACHAPQVLREWLHRLLALQPGLPDAHAQRLLPAQPMQGTLAWLEGRAAEACAAWQAGLAQEGHIDLLGQAADVRMRLAWARCRAGDLEASAGLLRPLVARGEPGGAVLAAEALHGLAAVDWGGRLPAEGVAELRRWSAGLPVGPAPGPAPGPVAAATPAVATDDRLSPRELEVLAQIAEGASNKLIARALDLSPHTVKRHVAHILDKLALSSRGQAAAWYRAHTVPVPSLSTTTARSPR